MAKFLAHELVLGQANLLFAATCSTALGALLRSRDAAAGALFGAAVLIKPYAVGFVPYLLLTRRWRAAAAAALATAAALALPLLQYGPEATLALMREWWHTVTETSVPLLTNADAISVYAMFAKWLGWGRTAAALSLVVVAALGAACAGVLACRGHVTRPEVLEIGILLTLIPLVTPQGWDYVLLLSTPLIALLISRTPQLSPIDRVVWVAAIVVVAFSLFDVLGRAAYGRFMALSIITVCYLAIIAIAVRLRLRGVA
jgi:alpha-1,2-mannosyltransferase